MKRLFIFLILALSIACPPKTRAQGWEWASGSTGGSEGYGIAIDPWGNEYISGYAGDSVHFGGFSLGDFGSAACVVAKYGPNGNFIWANSTHKGFAKPIDITCDASGNVYLLGYYITASTNVGSFILSNPGTGTELFLAKLNALDGSIAWAKNVCPGDITGNITFYKSNLYFAVTFDEASVSIGPFTLVNADPTGYTDDIMLVKADTTGNIIMAKRYGSPSDDIGRITVTPKGNVYMAGTSCPPSISFGAITLANVDTSLFIVKLDTAFNTLWAKNQEGIGKIGSGVAGVATDSAEDAFVSGQWRKTAYFGTDTLQADSVTNIFLVKYDSSGNKNWLTKVRGINQLGNNSIVADKCGNVWISGGLGDVRGGHSGCNYIEINGIKIDTPDKSADPLFIAEWNVAGTYIKSAMLPTSGDDQVSMAADAFGNIFVSGDYFFGPYTIGNNRLQDSVRTNENMFVVKFANTTTVLKNNICMTDSFVLRAPPGYSALRWDNGSLAATRTVTTPGTYNLYCGGECGANILMDMFIVNYGKSDTIYAGIDTSICLNAEAVLTAQAGQPIYQWSNGDTTQTDTITAPGTYWVVASGTCKIPTLIDTFVVAQNNINLAFSLGGDTAVCAPLLLAVPLPGVACYWQDGTTGNTDVAATPGLYYVNVSEQNCINKASLTVSFPDLLQHLQDTIFCQDRAIELTLTANVPPGASARWSNGSTQGSIYINQPGTYWVTVTDDACAGTDTMILGTVNCACKAVFPGGFTPNDDGKNDTYYPLIDKACNVFDYTFCIYNRWGNLLFATHDPAAKWDGTYKGIPQDTGTFMYFVSYCSESIFNRHTLKGDFTLIR